MDDGVYLSNENSDFRLAINLSVYWIDLVAVA